MSDGAQRCELPSRAHLAHDRPRGEGRLSPAEQTSCFQLWFPLGRGQLMRTLSDQCLPPDTSLAASTTDSTFSHLRSRWTTRSFTQYSHRRKGVILYIISREWITSEINKRRQSDLCVTIQFQKYVGYSVHFKWLIAEYWMVTITKSAYKKMYLHVVSTLG